MLQEVELCINEISLPFQAVAGQIGKILVHLCCLNVGINEVLKIYCCKGYETRSFALASAKNLLIACARTFGNFQISVSGP